jgi:hypothetical protein
MFIRRHSAMWLLLPVIALVCSGLGCPTPFGPLGGPGTTRPATSEPTEILLHIINRSGVDAAVSATFYVGTTTVRETSRLLPAAGVESTTMVVPTTTELVRLVAREADVVNPAARIGAILADEEIRIGPDANPGDAIEFIIHPAGFIDCNHNGVADSVDIATGVSRDSNLNGIPDECETTFPVTVVIGEISRVIQTDQAGATPTTLVDLGSYGLGSLFKLDVDTSGGYIYFTQTVSTNDGGVQRVPLAGGTPVMLISLQDTIGGMGLDLTNGKLYWSSHIAAPAGVRIASALLDGSGIQDVMTGLSGPVAKPFPEPLNGDLFFAINPSAGIYDLIQRADLNGSNVTDITTTATDPRDIDVWPEANLIVWAEYGAAGGIYTANLAGSNATRIASVPWATGVAIDRCNVCLYWTCAGTSPNTGFIERSYIDGTGVHRLLSGLNLPQDVAVYPSPF